MSRTLDTVLLLALPASGKSEVRRYLAEQPAAACRDDFHMGPTTQLDDYPYVHMMRRIDDELVALGGERAFFHAADRPFRDPRDWGTLVELLNEDYDDLVARRVRTAASWAGLLFDRMDAAAGRAGAAAKLGTLPAATRGALAGRLEAEAKKLFDDKHAEYPESLDGRTVVIEFARGGADGSAMPLDAPFGYRYSLALLSPRILEKATILYIWVTPEESRRKNYARTDPNDPGSILHHGVPIEVMMKDYGCDDMGWLVETSDRPDTVKIDAHGRSWHLPVARFDNRVDKTSWVRNSKEQWRDDEVRALHEGLRGALSRLAAAGQA
ncbi:MAG: hypothetical protein FJ087_19320 [Deltaproteobacteria bacterium]|nr:hypothetical protein [Deltaproteobacteria bacterium]